MSAENSYYAPCPEFDRCNELIDRYYKTKQYEPCFIGHLALAEKGYPLAECQVGYFYLEGLGVEKNLGWFYETGTSVPQDMEQAVHWYQLAAQQRQKEALDKLCL